MKAERLLFWAIIILITHSQCVYKTDRSKESLGQNNAIWSESIYLRGYRPSTHEYLTVDQIINFASTLKAHRIKYAYLFAGPYSADGHLPPYAFSDSAVQTVRLLKQYNPQMVILPWVGGVQNRTVYLGDSSWITNALADTKKLITTLGVSGVHVDLEYIKAGEPFLDSTIQKEKPGDYQAYGDNVNSFHRKLRSLIPDAFISSVVVATSPGTKPWKRKTSISELKELTKYVDQLAFLYYDTYINDQSVFEENCQDLIKDIETLRNERNIQYLIGIGTFINAPELQKYRNLDIENIPNTLHTIKNKIHDINSSKKLVDGIAIFCDWQTDSLEWKQFDDNWVNN